MASWNLKQLLSEAINATCAKYGMAHTNVLFDERLRAYPRRRHPRRKKARACIYLFLFPDLEENPAQFTVEDEDFPVRL